MELDPSLRAPADAPAAPVPNISFARLIGTSTAVKICMDTTVQFWSPFLSIVAAGMGTSVVVMGRLVSLRSAMGMSAPLMGLLSDRIGYRRAIRLSLTLAAAGILLVGISPNLWVAALGMAVMGLGTGSFLPLLQSYLSSRLPYALRARGLGIVEYSWALTGIVGLSAIGWLIAATNWRVPMVILSGLLLVAGWVVSRLPPTHHAEAIEAESAQRPLPVRSFGAQVRDYFSLGETARSTYATILTGALIYFAGNQLLIIYGAWLAVEFGLEAAALGTVAMVLGIFDLAAAVTVSLWVDRLGKRRGVIAGLVVSLAGFLAIPAMTTSVALAVLGIALARIGFEFAIVSYFPLLSEQAPAQRGKVMSLGSAILLAFGTAAGFTSPMLFEWGGIRNVALLSGAAVGGSLIVILTLVHERSHSAS